jgi:hypothetical protein
VVTQRARIDSLEAGLELLAGPHPAGLTVVAHTSVPDWIGELVDAARAAGVTVAVDAAPAADLTGDALAGWQIGVATAAFTAGVDAVHGIDDRRLARVREVVRSLADAAPGPTHTVGDATPAERAERAERAEIPAGAAPVLETAAGEPTP